MSYSIDLSGKVAIVTGGAGGIGYAIVQHLAMAGASIAIVDIVDPLAITKRLNELSLSGSAPKYLRRDIAQPDQCQALVQEVIDTLGRVDILVNNAGIETKDWQQMFSVNVMAQYNLANAVRMDMQKRHWGKIVNISSSAQFSGGGPTEIYNATKGAVDSVTRWMAKRFASDGINVNALAPGPVLTEMMQRYHGREYFEEHYLSSIPLGRLFAAEDMAKPVLFLCSELSDALCGETLLVDGGRVKLSPQ